MSLTIRNLISACLPMQTVALAIIAGMLMQATPAAAESLSWSAPILVDHPDELSGVAFSAIACPSTELCVAVDFSGDVVVATHPTGGAEDWTTSKIDSYYVANNNLEGVSCPSTSFCVAVDGDGNILSSANPTGGAAAWSLTHLESASNVREIACPSTKLCVAVDGLGDVLTATNPTGDASAWTATPIDSVEDELSSISCPTTSLCVAVDRAGNILTTTEPTGGPGAWTSNKIDSVEGALTGLSAVDCSGTKLCVAVDESGNLFTSTNPTGGASAWHGITTSLTNFGLTGLSCASEALCVGAGSEGAVLASTNPVGGASAWQTSDIDGVNNLTGVSCPSTSLCVAVDQQGNVLTGTTKQAEEPKTGGGGTTTTAPTTTTTTAQLTAPPSEPAPAPVLGQRQTASVISGTVTVRLKGTTKFVPLSGTSTIPDGSEVEATNGHVLITVATPNGKTQTAEVWGGRFLIHQEQAGSGETRFILSLPLTGCSRTDHTHHAGKALASSATHSKHSSGPKSRHLWVSEGGGSWGTNGRYISTSVEGTRWLTLDGCTRSEVKVAAGKVKVHDLVRNRTKTVTAGKRYTT